MQLYGLISMNAWWVVFLAAVIGILAASAGVLSAGTLVALALYVILGMLIPPIGIPLGAIAVVYLFFTHGKTIVGNTQKQIKGK